MGSGSRRLLSSGVALVVIALFSDSARAQGGTVTGRVATAGTGQPLAAAHVLVLAGSGSAIAGDDGRYTLKNVQPGNVELRRAWLCFPGGLTDGNSARQSRTTKQGEDLF